MFCDSDGPITKEHIFGAALSRRFTDQRLAAVSKSAASPPRIWEAPTDDKRYFLSAGMYPLAFTSHSMCKECNNLLGEEIDEITNLLERLFKGQTNTIPANRMELVIRYFQRIGILVDLETSAFDAALMTESEKDILINQHHHRGSTFLTPAERRMHLNGEILPSVMVFLGKHQGMHGKGFAMNVARFGGEGYHMGERTDAWQRRFIFSIKHVTCMLIIGTLDVNQNPKLQRLDTERGEFKIDHTRVSTDADVRLNYAQYTKHTDGSISAKLPWGF